ncbi:hypothetical protein PAPYR_12198 [Paratrimastix pyriformis]|uniref:Uncharacterized protein n=1 Tax=Paratrimastix pyriformis TaxID=342808 RepID=A0ABQ8U2A6_9EUKA|nr:hypothetical protein PAPYR_12198 [Paratrimastix pyriformis]
MVEALAAACLLNLVAHLRARLPRAGAAAVAARLCPGDGGRLSGDELPVPHGARHPLRRGPPVEPGGAGSAWALHEALRQHGARHHTLRALGALGLLPDCRAAFGTAGT